MPSSQQRPLGKQMLRGVGIFQVIVAFPAMCILGFLALDQLFYPYIRYYYFFLDVITALMAGGIVFIVYVQRKAIISSYQNFLFEAVKAILATALWLWLILDSAFGPWWKDWNKYRSPNVEKLIAWRVRCSALAVIVLVILFYPSLVYTYWSWEKESENENVESGYGDGGEERTERTPLLSQEDS
ncbi:hypothetical protein P280DRAFT_464489, partial [Massarina eburnea CBS 473.64]